MKKIVIITTLFTTLLFSQMPVPQCKTFEENKNGVCKLKYEYFLLEKELNLDKYENQEFSMELVNFICKNKNDLLILSFIKDNFYSQVFMDYLKMNSINRINQLSKQIIEKTVKGETLKCSDTMNIIKSGKCNYYCKTK
jgi:hypothetical protein